MRSFLFYFFLIVSSNIISAEWNFKSNRIRTPWSDSINPENVWQSYPRPQLKRSEWKNLNGLWEYSVTNLEVKKNEVKYESRILVPFAIESCLSGVCMKFTHTDKLWYKKEFTIDDDWNNKNILLHFGAVDYECSVWINNKLVGTHKGGNNPFYFDITKYIKKDRMQTLEIAVTDPTDFALTTRGKQSLTGGRIMYTPVSGIWKTVWLEPVEKTYIKRILPTTNIVDKTVSLNLDIERKKTFDKIKVSYYDGSKKKTNIFLPDQSIILKVPDAKLWSTASPNLYKFSVSLIKDNYCIDYVESYFALRKVSIQKDKCGYNKVALNDSIIFQYGVLDQGWWPDGLLTPPSEEAMLMDLVKAKNMGFNTIRKHIKVEPELYYYYADSLGIMVWQDMVSAFESEKRNEQCLGPYAEHDWNAPKEHAEQWEKELFEMIDCFGFYPSITTWCVFNEGWGQYNTVDVVNRVMDYDKTRIINGVTGWKDRGVGHMYDVHNYPYTCMILPENNGDRISALGEFGGLSLYVKEHLWNPNKRNWGYKDIDDGLLLLSDYTRLMYDLEALIAQGLGAAIYTQLADVESEVNGLMTYDRKVVKLPVELLHLINSRLYNVDPVKADILIPDGQNGKKYLKDLYVDGIKTAYALPRLIPEKKDLLAIYKFEVDKDYDNLSLWLNMSANVVVKLNGKIVFSNNIREFRQYTHFNISDYSNLLEKGENELVIEAKTTRKTNFDFGLRAF